MDLTFVMPPQAPDVSLRTAKLQLFREEDEVILHVIFGQSASADEFVGLPPAAIGLLAGVSEDNGKPVFEELPRSQVAEEVWLLTRGEETARIPLTQAL